MNGLIGVALRAAILWIIPENLHPQERVSRATALAIFGAGLSLGGFVVFVAGRMFLLPILADYFGGYEALATGNMGRTAMFALMGLCAIPVAVGFPVMNQAMMIRAEAQGKGIPLAMIWISSVGIFLIFIAGYFVWMRTQIPS